MDIQQLATVLSSTFDPSLREEAEKKLDEIHKVPGFLTLLLQVVMSDDIQIPVRQAGVIYLKNMIMQYWKERNPGEIREGDVPFAISEQDKVTIRQNVVEAVIHAPELIRLQLIVCVSQILKHDFPEKWPGVVDKITLYLGESSQATWMGALLALYQVVKKYEFKKKEERATLHQIMQVLLPVLYDRCVSLLANDSQPAVEVQKQILKIYFALIQYVLPLELITEENFPKWMSIFQAVVDRPVPQAAFDCDEDDRPQMAWWKVKKWALHILCRVFERYGTPMSITKEYSVFADFYCKNFSVSVTQVLLKVLDQYRKKAYVAPRVLQQTVNYLKNGISNAMHWKVMRPHMQVLIQEIIFPLMCYTDADDELWNDDPFEFIRIKYDIFEDFISPVAAAATLLHTAVKKRKQVLEPTMAFCVRILNTPAEQLNPRQKDGALHMIGTLSDILLKKKMYRNQLEPMLVQHVFPEFRNPLGYMRARACWMLHSFGEVSFQNEANLAQAVDSARLCLTTDKDPPVKVEAAIALQFLIEHQDESKKYIEPHVRPVILELLRVIRETENDDLTGVMQKLISTYGDKEQVALIAVDIAKDLAHTFMQLLDGDDSDEKAVTAMGILNTLETMLHVMDASKEIVHNIEQVVIGLIATVIQKSVMEFYEDILSIVCTCTTFEISQSMWTVFYMLYEAFQRDAYDYFTDMMPCLHNYITVDTPAFLSNPKNVEIIYSMCKKLLLEEPGEDVQSNAAKLLELTILQCQGLIDQWVPFFVEAALERLTRKVKGSELRTMCLQVAIAALLYSPLLLLSTLEKLQFPNTQESVTAQFFSQWINDADCFFGVHDRKVYVLGMCTLLDSPPEVRPQALAHYTPQILPALLLIFAGLKRAYENRDDDDEEESDGEGEEVELGSDEDEINEEDVEYIENLANRAANHLDHDDDDDDDDDDVDETPLEGFTTPIDDENMDEYAVFRSVLHNLHTREPDWYTGLTNVLTDEQKQALQDVFTLADQRQAALESKRIEAQGGYLFNTMSVPSTFKFGS